MRPGGRQHECHEHHHERDHPERSGEARRVQNEIVDSLPGGGFTDQDIFKIQLALEEALVNAIKHGNQMDPEKVVEVSYKIADDQFVIRIVDEGPGFNRRKSPTRRCRRTSRRAAGAASS